MRRRPRDPEPYQEYRQPLQQRWRPLILERDRHRCRVCGARDDLHMAHISDAVAFVRAAGTRRGVSFSYRWDNLYILCADCHRLSHRFRVAVKDVARQKAVHDMETQLRRLRGWSTPYAVLPPALVPATARPTRSFHDVMRISPLLPFPTLPRYLADGGVVFDDEEAPPAQKVLF